MLKRIVVLDDSGHLADALADVSGKREVEWLRVGPGSDVPPATCAAVATPESAEAALAFALAIGRFHEELLVLLAEAIDCRESFTPGNSMRVREHATRFAEALGLAPSERLTLERAALVRDIGKLRISNEVLLKADVLTYDEWALIRNHAHLGGAILDESTSLRDTADVVRHHHECWDGDGYPLGLEGEAIPRLARAMKILDVFCAMTSARRYRKGVSSHEQGLEHLRNERAKHFDPELVDVFLAHEVGRPPEVP